ncbi:RNB domain-containing ribonuclease [Leeia sp. TBRC 13508]|uniref:RNB domain-containing ribonuclease n=1 Tax=Leeia speluncae TaxID=2884804 RepID=A0ABS8D5H3_9NEIS|nr:RNB domain-containing ribonuclease [Leeia speluncae]MCB6183426.1 RNB domain-containing ribonuclease [Leeia speluncae]
MNVLFEEDGSFKVGHVMSEAEASLQIESVSGKRSKIKASNVMLRFKESLSDFLKLAEQQAEELDVDFLWEMAPDEEFGFLEFAADYYGVSPVASVQSAAMLIRLHANPMYFYRKGKGRFKAAPEESLKAAIAGQEKKRLQAEEIAKMADMLVNGQLPERFPPQVRHLLYKPDKNCVEYKALELAMQSSAKSALQLLIEAGGVTSHHDYHLGAFLFEYFPKGTAFPEVELATVDLSDLPKSTSKAFSIDDAATTEIDDAFSVEWMPDGGAKVGIHIAAPALGIEKGGSIDEIAMSRLSTVYMPGNKITMLPENLVSQFTLQEGRVCPALSLYVLVTPSGEISPDITRLEMIEVVANLRHDALEPVFNEETLANEGAPDYPWKRELTLLWKLANQLEVNRGKADANRPTQLDYGFVIDGEHVSIVPRKRGSPMDKLVSEWMILVNSHWGKLLADHDIPAIYRAQSAGKVRMTTRAEPHQGLGVAQYAWSSSPLRRAVDLINQRQLIACCQETKAPYPKGQDLFVPMREFDATYSAYLSFQDRMENYWCLRYLEQESITELDGVVLRDGQAVRLQGMPLVVKPEAMPVLPQGSNVRVKVLELNFWQNSARILFVKSDQVALAEEDVQTEDMTNA